MKVYLLLLVTFLALSVFFIQEINGSKFSKKSKKSEKFEALKELMMAKKLAQLKAARRNTDVKERTPDKTNDQSKRSKVKKRLHSLYTEAKREYEQDKKQEKKMAKRDELLQNKKAYMLEKDAYKNDAIYLTKNQAGCNSGQFECQNGQCIPDHWECDVISDCSDGSDESGCSCSSSQYTCDNGNCIPYAWLCDYDNDCGDYSDEKSCWDHGPDPSCSGDEFRCGDGECIPWYWECDSYKDCEDGSDEEDCQCGDGTFTCDNGSCIYASWECDDWDDCGDNSDEKNCGSQEPYSSFSGYSSGVSSSIVEPSSSLAASSSLASSSSASQSSSSSVQDSSSADYSSSDKTSSSVSSSEASSSSESSSSAGSSSSSSSSSGCDGFTCQNGNCIPATWECDNWDDCGDSSDENHCSGDCPSNNVRCPNGWKCIPNSWICDDYDDCGDNWDEQSCSGQGDSSTQAPCGWSAWGDWSQCNTGCNAGLKQRTRTCLCQTGGCAGESTEWEECPDDGCFPEAHEGCGTRVLQQQMGRIVGGETAPKGAWPWQAQLFVSGSYFTCGGTLVGPRHVISAAHCFQGRIYGDASNWNVHFGKHDLTLSVGTGESSSSVERLIIHENYDSQTQDNDIAMMILSEDQSPSDTINFACLDVDLSKIFNQTSDCFITGWGATAWQGDVADQLQEANVPLVDRATCNHSGSYGGAITDNMICAGFAAGGVDACQGDSGGPLVCSAKDANSDEDRWYLVGVTSWGYGCAFADYPGVYADVSKYMSWILNNINAN
ncbi:putative atrial natriuretic peptide-converting enzyme-like [Apostichopus japonicus]|uniref:Putative atrial natriuretic peptide-converting enzyme-like n=1 Tax=Stichopus japonicus TaxID=307972 RepID=A0A2G8KNJ3_STIJA|nr:putative atrial natriuretic peptide-converting enzyme-like [Apostichopus japonicus]